MLDDPRDVETLSEKILALSDPEKLRETSLAARRLAESYFPERSYRKMLKVLQEIKELNAQK